MATQPKPYITPAEYLARERTAEMKSEYFAGEMFLMVGATRQHNLIAVNVASEFRSQLRDRPCEVYPSDMRVKVSRTGLYTYPDVVVVCGEPRFEDDVFDTLLNPTLLVEVLSKSTETYDRGRKFEHYRSLPSLREYVLIAQDRPRIEHYVRQAEGQWLFSEATSLEQTLELPSIGCALALAEAYAKVSFEEAEAPRTESVT